MDFKTAIKFIMSIVSVTVFPLILQFWMVVSSGQLWGLSGFIGSIAVMVVLNALVWDQW